MAGVCYRITVDRRYVGGEIDLNRAVRMLDEELDRLDQLVKDQLGLQAEQGLVVLELSGGGGFLEETAYAVTHDESGWRVTIDKRPPRPPLGPRSRLSPLAV
jgi:hypothetical protein